MEPIFPANPTERVGYYGGRIAYGLWGEPLNVASDLCFIIIIILFFVKLRKNGFSDKPALILVILGGLMGFGSAIFHSHPTKVTLQIDLLPITIFGLAFIAFSTRRFFNQSYKISTLIPFAFFLLTLGFEKITNKFQIPGLNHIPSILALIIIGVLLLKNRLYKRVGKAFMVAAGSYILGLFFRYLDFYVYPTFPLGTHFLWHAFTFCVVIILLYTATTYGSIKHQGNIGIRNHKTSPSSHLKYKMAAAHNNSKFKL